MKIRSAILSLERASKPHLATSKNGDFEGLILMSKIGVREIVTRTNPQEAPLRVATQDAGHQSSVGVGTLARLQVQDHHADVGRSVLLGREI